MALDADACSIPQSNYVPEAKLEPNFGRQALMTYDSSYDTFQTSEHKNFLVGNAGFGIYAHGRIHQQFGVSIYVGDLIHKRGPLVSDDILLMEEQALLSMGEPLSTNSRMGELVTMAVLPTMNTANGEGDLIAYYENGVVSYNTFQFPRESRHDGDGKQIQEGWDSKRLVNHLLNKVSAVARYAVAVLSRDHLFRSKYGLHFLKVTLGEGTFNSENVNRISMDVEPILDADKNLSGAACGFWPEGHRMFATVGLQESVSSSSSVGRGFVSWNQALTYSEDRSPLARWEGLWSVDKGVEIHKFEEWNGFGFIATIDDNHYFAQIDKTLTADIRDEKTIAIPWSFETGRVMPSGFSKKSLIKGLTIEGVFSNTVTIKIRTDVRGTWETWKTFTPKQEMLLTESVGVPNVCKECTWAQVRVEGSGYCEINLIDLDFSESTSKSSRAQSYKRDYQEIDLWP